MLTGRISILSIVNMEDLLQTLADHVPSHRVLVISAAILVALVLAYRSFFILHYPKNLLRLGQREGISWSAMRKKFHEDSLTVFNDIYENVRSSSVLTPNVMLTWHDSTPRRARPS